MYQFSYFKEKDKQVILDFMEQHPFAFLSGCSLSGNPVATQIPFLIEEREGELYIQGHIMRNTDHHKALVENPNALVVFTGPSCYVSATWYSNQQIGSSWNYMSVHAHGTIRFGDEDELIATLKRLSLHFENGNTGSSTVFDNLPAEYTARMMKAIVPFEIEINDLQHVFKLSQDRDEESYDNIINELKKQEGDAKKIAEIMEERKSKVFPS
jgi:transcriptional regulator